MNAILIVILSVIAGVAVGAAPQPATAPHAHAAEKAAAVRLSQQEIARGRLFLSENAKKPGVVSLDNGLQYRVLEKGKGRSPQAGDRVTILYSGTLVDGKSIGRSKKDGKPGPASYRIDELMPGAREALKRMKEGDHWQVFVPPELGFPRGTGVLEQRPVILDLSLIAVERS